MPDRRLITDRTLKALRPAPNGSRLEIWDTREPGFGVRVSDREDADPQRRGKAGKITFVLYGRFTTGAPPTRRVIGDYPGVSLEQARDTAGRWKSLVGKGIDPSIVEAEARSEAARVEAWRNQANFGAIAETWLLDKVRKERRGKPVERVFRVTFVTAWGERAITEITPLDVLAIINAKKRKAPEIARALLTMISRFFNWAIDQQVYGITSSPCDRLKATKLIGERTPRTRRLNDIELFAFWRATRRSDCPVCAAYRTLLLTGLRLNEAVEMSWSEFADDSTVIIPASRMKAREAKAREHLVPLSRTAQKIIAKLPRPKGATFLFSYDGGKRPLILGTKAKRRLDRRMQLTLRALARRNGEDHTQVRLTPWVNHDLRRVVRSGLSALRVPHNVAEAVLAHRQNGIVGTYDLHEYEQEKREALEAWANRVASIVDPKPATPAKIIRLRWR